MGLVLILRTDNAALLTAKCSDADHTVILLYGAD